MVPIIKPTIGVSGWGPAVDTVIDRVNALSGTIRRRAVATRSNAYNQGLSNGTVTGGTYRTQHVSPADATEIGLVYGNHYGSLAAQVVGPNAITVRCSLDINGYLLPLYGPDGARDIVISPGALVEFRASGIRLKAGQTFWVRTYVTVASAGQKWPVGLTTYHASGEGTNASATPTDLTTSGTVPLDFVYAYSPIAVTGLTMNPAALLVGDSILAGQGDNPNDAGFAVGGLADAFGLVRICQPSETGASFVSAYALRSSLARYCDTAICEYGRNDLSAGNTLAQLQSMALFIWGLWKAYGIPTVVQTTITPQSSSNDDFATTAGQSTGASNTVRVNFNNWLRAGAPIDPTTKAAVTVGTPGALIAGSVNHALSEVWEVADLAETTRDSGLWKTTGRVVTDGAITSGTATLTSATAAFTSGDVGKRFFIAGAGAAAADLTGTIASVQSGTQATVSVNASTTVSAARTSVGGEGYTLDGTHPSAAGHLALRAAIKPAVVQASALV